MSAGIKKILKKILPVPFLKDVFLLFNKVRIRSVDKVLFPEYKIDKKEFSIYRNGFPFRESGVMLNDLPENEVKVLMRSWYEWTQEEFLLRFNTPCWIEPDYGWAIVEPMRLVYYSLGVSRTLFQRKPSLYRFFRKKNILKFQRTISLRDTGEENYFHFYNDVLTKIFFLTKQNIDIVAVPVIISKKLWDKKYFQFYLQHLPLLSSINWAVQGPDQYIQSNSTIFCKPLTHRIDLWNQIFNPITITGHSGVRKKIYLTRGKTRLRFIENSNEIEAVCKRHGLEVLDADHLGIEEQIKLFAQTSVIVGIHGAGLTNMIYSLNCKVLEIFPPPDLGYLPYHYILLANMKGFPYRGIIGERGKNVYSGGFYLDPVRFETELTEFL